MTAVTCSAATVNTATHYKIISYPKLPSPFSPNKSKIIFPKPKSTPKPSDLLPFKSSDPFTDPSSSLSPQLSPKIRASGYDFFVVDIEHGPAGITDALACLRALATMGTSAILRLPESCPIWAKKALDLGPRGIKFPMIDSPKAAKNEVPFPARWNPRIGSYGGERLRASNYGIDEGHLSNYDDELLIMCQVESEEEVKRVEDIAAVDGVDCVQMGPLELSRSMGCIWNAGHKKVAENGFWIVVRLTSLGLQCRMMAP